MQLTKYTDYSLRVLIWLGYRLLKGSRIVAYSEMRVKAEPY